MTNDYIDGNGTLHYDLTSIGDGGSILHPNQLEPDFASGFTDPYDPSWGASFSVTFINNMFSSEFYNQQLTDTNSCFAVFQTAAAEPLHAVAHLGEVAKETGAALRGNETHFYE